MVTTWRQLTTRRGLHANHPVTRPRFGRPERTEIREHFAREVLASDTSVEAPYMPALDAPLPASQSGSRSEPGSKLKPACQGAARIRGELETVQAAAERDHLALTTHLVFPKLNDTFWVNLIGRG